MARSIPARQHPLAETDDGEERQVSKEATDARSGNRDRDVFVVLMISTALAVLVLLGALAYYSEAMSGFGNQTRSPSTFENPSATSSPARTLPPNSDLPAR
jgi:hypothetical protein